MINDHTHFYIFKCLYHHVYKDIKAELQNVEYSLVIQIKEELDHSSQSPLERDIEELIIEMNKNE